MLTLNIGREGRVGMSSSGLHGGKVLDAGRAPDPQTQLQPNSAPSPHLSEVSCLKCLTKSPASETRSFAHFFSIRPYSMSPDAPFDLS